MYIYIYILIIISIIIIVIIIIISSPKIRSRPSLLLTCLNKHATCRCRDQHLFLLLASAMGHLCAVRVPVRQWFMT